MLYYWLIQLSSRAQYLSVATVFLRITDKVDLINIYYMNNFLLQYCINI